MGRDVLAQLFKPAFHSNSNYFLRTHIILCILDDTQAEIPGTRILNNITQFKGFFGTKFILHLPKFALFRRPGFNDFVEGNRGAFNHP